MRYQDRVAAKVASMPKGSPEGEEEEEEEGLAMGEGQLLIGQFWSCLNWPMKDPEIAN
jgi:hypothetical protein